MTKDEKIQFTQAWLEAENIITLLDPYFQPEVMLKRPEESGPQEIKKLLQFLRIQVKLFLHDKESTERERNAFYKMLQEQEIFRRE